jgi:hypothetical protein
MIICATEPYIAFLLGLMGNGEIVRNAIIIGLVHNLNASE